LYCPDGEENLEADTIYNHNPLEAFQSQTAKDSHNGDDDAAHVAYEILDEFHHFSSLMLFVLVSSK